MKNLQILRARTIGLALALTGITLALFLLIPANQASGEDYRGEVIYFLPFPSSS